MSKINTKLTRVDVETEKVIKDLMKARLQSGLAKFTPRELSFAEGLRLSLRCPSWSKVEQELKTLPKRRDNGK